MCFGRGGGTQVPDDSVDIRPQRCVLYLLGGLWHQCIVLQDYRRVGTSGMGRGVHLLFFLGPSGLFPWMFGWGCEGKSFTGRGLFRRRWRSGKGRFGFPDGVGRGNGRGVFLHGHSGLVVTLGWQEVVASFCFLFKFTGLNRQQDWPI